MNPRKRVGGRDKRSQGSLPRKRSTRNYYGLPRRWLYAIVICVLLIVMVVSASQLISYVADYTASQHVSDELRDIYYGGEETLSSGTDTEAPVPAATETPVSQTADSQATDPQTADMQATDPTDTPVPEADAGLPADAQLEAKPYPDNPYLVVSDQCRRLQTQNQDIIGWLHVDRLIDEAVVQRDNSYYLRRDYLGYHNTNGALFLDESISLKTRPYSLIIYGHNMQTGAMFGVLRNYENRSFLIKNPFISFDLEYETGRYVIFAVSTISTNPQDKNFVNLAKMNSMTIAYRNETIAALQHYSVYTSTLDVRADDQILMLVTCVDDEDERRIVCARRIRDGESEESLANKVSQMWSK